MPLASDTVQGLCPRCLLAHAVCEELMWPVEEESAENSHAKDAGESRELD